MDAKSAYDGLSRILAASSSPEPSNRLAKTISIDATSAVENGVTSQVEEKQVESPNEKEENSPIPLQIPETTPHESWKFSYEGIKKKIRVKINTSIDYL